MLAYEPYVGVLAKVLNIKHDVLPRRMHATVLQTYTTYISNVPLAYTNV